MMSAARAVALNRSAASRARIARFPIEQQPSGSTPEGSALECRIKCHLTGREVHSLDELTRLTRARFPVHAAVFPFDRQRTAVADLVERADDLLEVYAATARRAKIPTATRIAKRQMAAENAA